jgi:hypothetical protein
LGLRHVLLLSAFSLSLVSRSLAHCGSDRRGFRFLSAGRRFCLTSARATSARGLTQLPLRLGRGRPRGGHSRTLAPVME